MAGPLATARPASKRDAPKVPTSSVVTGDAPVAVGAAATFSVNRVFAAMLGLRREVGNPCEVDGRPWRQVG